MDGERVEIVREGFLGAQLRLQCFGMSLRTADFRFEVVHDPILGGGNQVRVADRHANQHAHRQGEQDSGQRERVVAIVEHAQTSSWSLSQSRSTTSRRAGVIQTTAIIAIRPAATTTSSGVRPGRG